MNYYTGKSESNLHKWLVTELLKWLRDSKAYKITAADLEGFPEPEVVNNKHRIGDGQDKQPDIEAFDDNERVYIRGEAKTGEGDLATEHTKTQLLLFSDRFNRENGKPSLLYIIVPADQILNLKVLLRQIGLSNKSNVIPVKSGRY